MTSREVVMTPTAYAILEAVSAEHEVGVAELLGRDKARHVAAARAAAWRKLRDQKDARGRSVYTLARIASWFGVSHSAVSQALDAVKPEG